MSEPTIRLPLRAVKQGPQGPTYIIDVDGRTIDLTALVSLVNSQAERIRGLEEALRYTLNELVMHPPAADWACVECKPHSHVLDDGFLCGYHSARAALDKAGKEGA